MIRKCWRIVSCANIMFTERQPTRNEWREYYANHPPDELKCDREVLEMALGLLLPVPLPEVPLKESLQLSPKPPPPPRGTRDSDPVFAFLYPVVTGLDQASGWTKKPGPEDWELARKVAGKEKFRQITNTVLTVSCTLMRGLAVLDELEGKVEEAKS
jgi:hypothetical protein